MEPFQHQDYTSKSSFGNQKSSLRKQSSGKNNKKPGFWTIRKLVIVLVVIGVGISGFFFFQRQGSFPKVFGKKDSRPEDNAKKEGSNELIEQFKQDLPKLEEQAKTEQPQDLQNLAVAQYATGDVKAAEETYKKQVTKDKDNPVAHNNLGNALRDQGKYDEAAKEYEKAIEIAPKTMTSYINLGNMYQYAMNQKDKALEIYKKAISAKEDAVDMYVLSGILEEERKNKDAAKGYFDQALKIQPDNQAAKAGLDRLK